MHEKSNPASLQTPSTSAAKSARPRLLLGAGLAVVVLVAGGLWYLRRPAPPPELPALDLTDVDPEIVQAIHDAEDGVWKTPRAARAWGRLGMVLTVHGFHDQALGPLAEAERLEPGEARWPYLQGMILERDEPERAIAKLRRAVELSSQQGPHLRLAQAFLAQGRLDEAETQFKASRSGALRPWADLGLARVARARGRPQESLELLRGIEGRDAPMKAAHTLRAELYGQLPGKEAEARYEREAEARLPIDPPWSDPYAEEVLTLQVGMQARLDRARDLRRAGRPADAARLLADATPIYPNAEPLWRALGESLLQAKEYRKAEEAFQEAVRCDPYGFEAHYRLGLARYSQLDRRPEILVEAGAAFRAAIKLAPTLNLPHFFLALCLQEQGNRFGAAAEYQAALRCRPDYLEAQRNVGQLLAEGAEAASAAAILRPVLGCPFGLDCAVLIRMKAVAHLSAAARLAPEDLLTRGSLNILRTEYPPIPGQ
jgi:tetratricopeptide (TPR) repeat protein